MVGILGVETSFGRITGRYRVIDALATLAFDYPPRGEFFRGELQQFLLLSREESVDPRTALGSYAGAMGAPQFISSSYRKFAVDGDGDGHRDLWTQLGRRDRLGRELSAACTAGAKASRSWSRRRCQATT